MLKLNIAFCAVSTLFILVLIATMLVSIIFDTNKEYIKLYNRTSQINYNVTRIIHQSWKTKNIPKIFQRYVPSWKACYPSYVFKLWTDKDNRDLIVEHYPWFLSKYDNMPASIHRADCARYFYLFHYGGIYTDLDNECLYPFEHLLSNYSLVFGSIENVNRETPLKAGYVQNSFMYSRPSHPFWLNLLTEIYNSNIEIDRPDVSTGPEMLCKELHKYLLTHPNTEDVRIYAGQYFNPLTWGNTNANPPFCKPFNKMSDDEYLKCRKYYKVRGSYVVQYHTHVW